MQEIARTYEGNKWRYLCVQSVERRYGSNDVSWSMGPALPGRNFDIPSIWMQKQMLSVMKRYVRSGHGWPSFSWTHVDCERMPYSHFAVSR